MSGKKKILIISYGGTIVMVVDEARHAVVPAKDIESIIKLIPNLNTYADIDMAILSNKDSTNVGPEDWVRIAHYIEKRYDEFDGFVITHGTNTLSYTATALAFTLGKDLSKPVVITGSQLPLTVYGNDARFNFENAVRTATEAANNDIGEVLVVFNDKVFRGCRTVKVSESAFSAFDSPAFPPAGRITSTGIHLNLDLLRHKQAGRPLEIQASFNSDILSIDLVPGQSPDFLFKMAEQGECRAMIIKSHGAGSVPTEGTGSFIPLIHRVVKELGMPVLVATKFLGGNSIKEVNDEPALLALEAGAIPTGDMTDVAAEVKLMWLLGMGTDNLELMKKRIHKDYIGEITI